MEKLEYIDGLVTTFMKEQLVNVLEDIINELRDEEYFDEDIYDYINQIVLTILHNKYGDILKKLKNG